MPLPALHILPSNDPARCNAGKIAQFMGLPFAEGVSAEGALPTDREVIVVAHWSALKDAVASKKGILEFVKHLKALFVYGWNDSPASTEFLRQLSAGAVLGAKANGQSSHHISVAADSGDLCLIWSGLEFEVDSGPGGVGFQVAPDARPACRAVISRDGEPFLVQLTVGGSQVALAGHDEIADLDAPMAGTSTPLAQFERLAPLMMFLRKHFGELCWTPQTEHACFIIDDPLLQPCYGHLDYQELLASMLRARYSASIAFIPWNYRRTDPKIAALFQAHPEYLSICVHGCDHTGAEFAGTNESRLRGLAATALWRMERHEHLSGLRAAHVMVFPQGKFSTHAMRALGQTRLLAAVNTDPYPVDWKDSYPALRDLLEPAITKFSNFPLFVRRYPRSVAECILDLFVGKPLLLVEHHGYFREGCQPLEDFVAKINALAPRLQWTDLDKLCSRASWRRIDSGNQIHVRFWTDRFFLTNDSSQSQSYVLHRCAVDENPPAAAMVNGREIQFSSDGEYLQIPLTLEPGGQAEVILQKKHPQDPGTPFRQGPIEKTKVFLRRRACDFRDNVLDKKTLGRRAARLVLKLARRRHKKNH